MTLNIVALNYFLYKITLERSEINILMSIKYKFYSSHVSYPQQGFKKQLHPQFTSQKLNSSDKNSLFTLHMVINEAKN